MNTNDAATQQYMAKADKLARAREVLTAWDENRERLRRAAIPRPDHRSRTARAIAPQEADAAE
jgi:hypothetical protein